MDSESIHSWRKEGIRSLSTTKSTSEKVTKIDINSFNQN